MDELNTPCGIYMGDDKLITKTAIVNLHPSVGTHWVMYRNKYHFDSCGCQLNIMNHINKSKNSEYQMKKS